MNGNSNGLQVDSSDSHTIAIIDVASGAVWGTSPGGAEKIVNLAWSTNDTFMTVGTKHCCLWKLASADASCTLTSEKALYGGMGSQLAVASLPSGMLVTGGRNGSVYVWQGAQCVQAIKAAHKGLLASPIASGMCAYMYLFNKIE